MYRFYLVLLLFSSLVSAEKQNVLLITIDTLRADHLGCYGDRTIHTPNLDALASGSLFFENAVCPAPLTLVSHTSLLTGRYPYHHGIHDNAGVVPSGETTLAEILKQSGYHTYAIIGGFPLDHRFGLNQGFDVYNDTFPRDPNRSLDFRSERPANAVVDAALSLQLTAPYFLWIHFYDPHAPYLHGGYEGEIEFVDRQVGRFLSKLKTANTIITVAGDHGESLGEHGEFTHRIFIYESTMHVPFWIKGPGISSAHISAQARLIDFMPTLLAALQIPQPKNLDGGVLPKSAGAPAVLESLFPQLELGWAPLQGIRTNEWKFIQAPKPELYDLRSDPTEKTDLASKLVDRVNYFRFLIPQPKAPTQSTSVSPEMQEQLSSLGYVSGNSGRTVTNIDAKDRIGVWNEIEQAVDLEKTDPTKAVAILEKARKADPQNPMVLGFLAQKYTEANRLPEAKQLLSAVLKQDPENVLALHRMATVCLRSGQYSEAIQWAAALQKMNPEDPDAYILTARANLRMNRLQPAIENLEQALKIDARDYDLRNDLGNLYLQTSNLPMARKQFTAVLALDRRNLQALNGLATCDFMSDNYTGAETYLKKATIINAKDPQTQMNLALLYSNTGRKAQAVQLYQQLLNSPDTPPDWKVDAAARLKDLQ